MKTELFVYTGTGNSLWIAHQLAAELKEAAIEFIPSLSGDVEVNADRVGIIFPVHIWGLPRRVIRFINHLKTKSEVYFFAGKKVKRVRSCNTTISSSSPWIAGLQDLTPFGRF